MGEALLAVGSVLIGALVSWAATRDAATRGEAAERRRWQEQRRGEALIGMIAEILTLAEADYEFITWLVNEDHGPMPQQALRSASKPATARRATLRATALAYCNDSISSTFEEWAALEADVTVEYASILKEWEGENDGRAPLLPRHTKNLNDELLPKYRSATARLTSALAAETKLWRADDAQSS